MAIDPASLEPTPENFHQLALAYRQALESSQFKTGFLARTSHDLRSPLHGLISGLQLILTDLCDSPEEEREYIQIAHDSALKLVELIDQVISVSKINYGAYPLKMQAVDLDLALQEAQMIVHLPAANRNLRLNMPMLAETVEVWADLDGLRQALVLLLDGAIGAMQEGGIRVAVQMQGKQAVITIVDDRPVSTWAEIRDLLQTKASDQLIPAPRLSANFQLILARDLIQAMGGELHLVEVEDRTQLQFWLKTIG
jgi:signal transduction histidine kinase